MPLSRSYRAKAQDYVFILWGDRFEETVVAMFVTELRNPGLCVKVVGLAGQRSTGKHGLVLYSDLTLGEALELADKAICVIIPCNSAIMKRVDNDPRVLNFFRQAHANHAQFVMSERDTLEKSSLQTLSIPHEELVFYAEHADLTAFAREMASVLMDESINL